MHYGPKTVPAGRLRGRSHRVIRGLYGPGLSSVWQVGLGPLRSGGGIEGPRAGHRRSGAAGGGGSDAGPRRRRSSGPRARWPAGRDRGRGSRPRPSHADHRVGDRGEGLLTGSGGATLSDGGPGVRWMRPSACHQGPAGRAPCRGGARRVDPHGVASEVVGGVRSGGTRRGVVADRLTDHHAPGGAGWG